MALRCCSQAEWSVLNKDANQKEVSMDDLSMCDADGLASLSFFSIIGSFFQHHRAVSGNYTSASLSF